MPFRRDILILALAISAFSAASSEGGGLFDDLHLVLGGMRPGSGIGGGVELDESHFQNGVFDLKLQARVSIRLYQEHEAELTFPHVFDDRLFVQVLGSYRSFTQIDYFGIGRDSIKARRSNYGLEGGALSATIGFHPVSRVSFGGRAGRLNNSVRKGRNDDLPSIEEEFDPSSLPGLVEQPDYYLVGLFAEFDLRNDPDDPTRGAFYQIQATRYLDVGSNRFGFRELEASARHFLPLGRCWTFASRVKTVMTWTVDGGVVPFFLLPTLGGVDSLQAFGNDRFRDRNAVLMNAELRYRATGAIRLSLFVGAGEVFPRVKDLRFDALELSSGVGAEYKLGKRILMGVYLGVGREGARVSLKGDYRF